MHQPTTLATLASTIVPTSPVHINSTHWAYTTAPLLSSNLDIHRSAAEIQRLHGIEAKDLKDRHFIVKVWWSLSLWPMNMFFFSGLFMCLFMTKLFHTDTDGNISKCNLPMNSLQLRLDLAGWRRARQAKDFDLGSARCAPIWFAPPWPTKLSHLGSNLLRCPLMHPHDPCHSNTAALLGKPEWAKALVPALPVLHLSHPKPQQNHAVFSSSETLEIKPRHLISQTG